jgi:SAM-dependent methyltransferase
MVSRREDAVLTTERYITATVGAVHQKLVFDRRTQVLASKLGAVVPEGTVLDVGCGDGTIDAIIQEARPSLSIRGVDIMVRPQTKIPVEPFDGVVLPAHDRSVDSVLFVDVLHHTRDPIVLLREAKRVARKGIVIKDHCSDGIFDYPTLRFMDWVGNAPHGVVLPYNYWSRQQWQTAFAELQLKVTSWEDRLGLYPFPASMIFERKLHFIALLTP